MLMTWEISELTGWKIEVILDTEARCLDITLIDRTGERIHKRPMNHDSLKALSSSLRCEIGYGPAVAMLSAHDIPHDSDLWHLNHDNPWRPSLLRRNR